MTEQDYYLLCIGARDKDANEWRKVRTLAWYGLHAPHSDPQKLPKNVIQFMPIGDEKVPKLEPIPQEVLQQWDKMFRGLA